MEFGKQKVEGIVKSVGYYSKDNVPYPLEKTKEIIEDVDYNYPRKPYEINYELFSRNVKVTFKNGRVFIGQFYEIFDEENTIMIGNTIIDIKAIAKMEDFN